MFPLPRPQLHKPVRFSTGPFTEYTHWKQTVFYLRQPLTICKGESIKGKITVKPNDKVREACLRDPTSQGGPRMGHKGTCHSLP